MNCRVWGREKENLQVGVWGSERDGMSHLAGCLRGQPTFQDDG